MESLGVAERSNSTAPLPRRGEREEPGRGKLWSLSARKQQGDKATKWVAAPGESRGYSGTETETGFPLVHSQVTMRIKHGVSPF